MQPGESDIKLNIVEETPIVFELMQTGPAGAPGGVTTVNGRNGVVVLTADDVGLEDVDNTSDADKPVSTAQATAIGVVQSDINAHEANTSNPHSVTKTQVGLGNADNTSDANKPISTATQTALDAKANDADVVHDTGNETVAGIKTFSSSPIVPTPTTDFQAATKKYVDDNGGGGGGAVDSVNGQTGVVVLDQDDVGDGTTYKQYSQTEKTKLAGIETAADVTDAANVGAAGAFMKSVDDTDDITVGTTNKFATAAEKTKLGHITVTQAVDLDTMESDIAGKVTGPASVTDDLPAIFDGTTGKLIKQKTYAAFKTLLSLVKGDVGLGNVDNTSDLGKPVSTAQQTALDLKADLTLINNRITVSQTAHGFVVGDVLRSSGTDNQYAKAQANNSDNAEVVGIVTTVTNANTFTLTLSGVITTGVPAEDAGTVMFLSEVTAGALTATEPDGDGEVSKPLLIILDDGTSAALYNFRGIELGPPDPDYATQEELDDGLALKANIASPAFTGTVTLPTGLTGVLRADSGVVTTDTDVTDLVTAASTTAQGKVELAIASEVNTGTDATRAVTPDSLAGSNLGTKTFQIAVTDPNGAVLATGDGQAYVRVPESANGMNIISVAAEVVTKSTSGNPTIQIARGRQPNATTIHTFADTLSTALTIDANDWDSKDAATPAVINTSNDDLATGDLLRVDVDTAGTGTKGLIVIINAQLP